MKYICANCNEAFTRKANGNYVLNFCCKECYDEYRKREYIDKFNSIYGNQFYVISFIGNKVNIRCEKCGSNIQRVAKHIWGRDLLCRNCCDIEKQHKDAILNELKDKRKKLDDLIKRLEKCNTYITTHTNKCEVCGKEYIGSKKSKYCSDKCKNKILWYNNKLKRERHIKNNGLIDKDITLAKLYERDKGICYLCGCECDYSDFEVSNDIFKVGKTYPSIEHIIPISKGGTHSWDNIKLAHISCNSKKSDK